MTIHDTKHLDSQREKYTIRKLDTTEIDNIVHGFVGSYYSINFDIDKLIEKFQTYAVVISAFVDMKPIGYVAYYRNDINSIRAYISMVVVKEEFRRLGVATKMLEYVINDCKSYGFRTIELEVNKFNAKAIKLYEHLGFKNVKDSPRVDGAYYTKELN